MYYLPRSTLKLYKWIQSHFTTIDVKSTNELADMLVCTTSKEVLIILVHRHDNEGSAVVETYGIAKGHLSHIQDLYLKNAETYTYGNQCFLLASSEGNNL